MRKKRTWKPLERCRCAHGTILILKEYEGAKYCVAVIPARLLSQWVFMDGTECDKRRKYWWWQITAADNFWLNIKCKHMPLWIVNNVFSMVDNAQDQAAKCHHGRIHWWQFLQGKITVGTQGGSGWICLALATVGKQQTWLVCIICGGQSINPR